MGKDLKMRIADMVELQSNLELLNTLIEKIVIHEQIDEDGNKVMPIEIYYRFIGNVGIGS